MASIFAKIQDRAERAGIVPYTEKSREWFMQRLRKMSNVTSQRVLADDRLNRMKRPLIGRMFMFLYDPKWKNTLPYYDRFPLILMVGPAEGGFYGLNLHYLSPRNRAVFFDCFKHYLYKNVQSHTVEIPPSEWEIALFMPTEDFVGEKNRNIWNKSKTLVSDMNS
jgi:hypothetical protein